jgi:biotin synthase-like enzyme
MRNCTWNRCTFCPVYKGTRASQRDLDEILADVEGMAAAAAELGGPGASSDRMLRALDGGAVPPEAMQVALFLRGGARHVFLQDADPCAVRPDKLVRVLERVRERFPSVERVTTYGRAATLARRRPSDLVMLREAGLTRAHLGLESGSDPVLDEVCKGATAEQLIAAGSHVLQAGLELCFYVMPGLGGERLSAEHVRGTAEVIRAVAPAATPERPLVVRLRTAAVSPGTPLAEAEQSGRFRLPDDVAIAAELRELLKQVGDARFELRSDHALNLLPELEGSLPNDRERLMAVVDRYLGLPEGARAEFALGARLGVFRRLSDLDDPRRRDMLTAQTGLPSGAANDPAVQRELLDVARSLRSRFI